MSLFRKWIIICLMIPIQTVNAGPTCKDLFGVVVDSGPAVNTLPNIVENLKIISPHQVRTIRSKRHKYLVVDGTRIDLNDPIYKQFQANSIEIVISGTGGTFRHIILRVGNRVYDFAGVQNNRTGDEFRLPSNRTDAKGLAFVVGQKKIAEVQEILEAVYAGSKNYNNPPFSVVGGKLVIEQSGSGAMRFRSEERVWIPGNQNVNINRNNRDFQGRLVDVDLPNGSKKLFLENPYGVRMPVSTANDGTLYVMGLSCASSAVYVFKHIFALELADSTSAANLVKQILEGRQEGAESPDALVLYGQERRAPEVALTEPSKDRSQQLDNNIAETIAADSQPGAATTSPVRSPERFVETGVSPRSTPPPPRRAPVTRRVLNWFLGR
jgi:hypothetical protein